MYKLIGVTHNELLGQIVFYSLFIGVNITFLPLHFVGHFIKAYLLTLLYAEIFKL